jgi:hypothetical protein
MTPRTRPSASRWLAVLFFWFFTASAEAQEATARYRVTFEATWSAATHPTPTNAHFSPLIGGTHDQRLVLWEPGETASFAIEEMAERGLPQPLRQEVGAAIPAGTAGQVVEAPEIDSPGTVSVELLATEAHPLLTLVTMVAPSPDWFVGVAGLPLRTGGKWVEGRVAELFAWDAGTDSGRTFRTPNVDTQPREPIHLLGAPFPSPGPPLGRFVIERLDAPPVAPLPLADGAFEVSARWQVPDGTFGTGRGAEVTRDTGSFWFFDPANVELIVKVIDACPVNGHRWVFAAGLTSVAVDLVVTETATGTERRYRNPQGVAFQPVQDTLAFRCETAP